MAGRNGLALFERIFRRRRSSSIGGKRGDYFECYVCFSVSVVLLIACLGVKCKALEPSSITSPSISGNSDDAPSVATTIWDDLFFNEVPFPGVAWLSKAATAEGYRYDEQSAKFSSPYEAILEGTPERHLVKNFNCFINSFIFTSEFATSILNRFGVSAGHYFLCYLRNLLAGIIIYYGTAGIFHYFCYVHPMSNEIFKDRIRPNMEIIWDQIKLAQASLFVYVALPVFSDFLIEENLTKTYYTIDDIGGWHLYIFYLVLYMALVEIGIYWMHRTLHTNKILYKYIHLLHHKYKTPEMLTPWASIAFNPLDGILQASPYVVCLFLVPCHYLTHVALLFFTAVWATYIHDAMDWNIDPIMGSKYHTVHHTHYMYNFGQIFTFCDAFWGTLRVPTEKTGVIKKL